MLVITRRQNERLVFPNLGITLEVLRTNSGSVRLGIEAPSQVRVLRAELADKDEIDCSQLAEILQTTAPKQAGVSAHRLRNRLNRLVLGLHLAQKRLNAGITDKAEETLDKTLRDLLALDRELGGPEKSETDQEAEVMRRALLVEDDRNERELLAGFLRMSGFRVDVASNGCAALEHLAKRGRPDCVLLDMLMPAYDGAKTVAQIRENPAYDGLKVFAVSGMAPAQMGVKVSPDGVNRWFSKPINPESLVSEIRRELDKKAKGADPTDRRRDPSERRAPAPAVAK